MQRYTKWTQLKYIKREINKVLLEDKNMQLVYTGTKFSTKFNVKDKTKKDHHQDLTYMMRCAIWCRLYNFKNVKNTHGGVLILVKL